MTSLELNWITAQIEYGDSTEETQHDEEDDEIRMDGHINATIVTGSTVSSSAFLVRNLPIDRNLPRAAPPVGSEAAFSQWRGRSGLTLRQM